MKQVKNNQPHEQDDCEGCQAERAQNNKLIQFYQRLSKLKSKVDQIKPQIKNSQLFHEKQKKKLQKIAQQLKSPACLKNDVQNYDSKQIGYQLTCALLQRQIKIKKQNSEMAKKINHLTLTNQNKHRNQSLSTKIDSEMQSQPVVQMDESFFITKNKSKFSDSLDFVVDDNNKSFWNVSQKFVKTYQKNTSRYQNQSSKFSARVKNQNLSNYSAFQDTGKFTQHSAREISKSKKPNTNLNLWLYQYNNLQDTSQKNIKLKTRNKSVKKHQ